MLGQKRWADDWGRVRSGLAAVASSMRCWLKSAWAFEAEVFWPWRLGRQASSKARGNSGRVDKAGATGAIKLRLKGALWRTWKRAF